MSIDFTEQDIRHIRENRNEPDIVKYNYQMIANHEAMCRERFRPKGKK